MTVCAFLNNAHRLLAVLTKGHDLCLDTLTERNGLKHLWDRGTWWLGCWLWKASMSYNARTLSSRLKPVLYSINCNELPARESNPLSGGATIEAMNGKVVTWLILPVVICLSQRLSHACLSINKFVLWNCEWLIKSVIVYLMVSCYMDNCGNSRANTCNQAPTFWKGCIY
jgi:hypothetical protein